MQSLSPAAWEARAANLRGVGCPAYTGELDLAGLHLGLDIRAYGAILEANQGEFTGLRFRRVQDLVAGRRALLREAAVHRIGEGAEDRLFWWE